MRGKPRLSAKARVTRRITPADAGKTGFALKNIFADWDHPRGCGENHKEQVLYLSCLGSPPRMRGKRGSCEGCPLCDRITPAGAGKTSFIPYLPFLK